MASRIAGSVVRGEIDNTVEGRTTGRIWLVGRVDAITLRLEGDCWRDLAGARLHFWNPEPTSACAPALTGHQRGVVGDMTASRKSWLPQVSPNEALARESAGDEIPCSWRNSLYLEWFSEADGRVLIESSGFEVSISEPIWRMDEDGEEAQKLANLHAMRDCVARLVATPDLPDGGADDIEWSDRLRDAERVKEAFSQVREKYRSDPDSERKEAFAMGWDGLLEAMAQDDPREAMRTRGSQADPAPLESHPSPRHPLLENAHQIALRGIDLARAGGDHPAAGTLTSSLVEVADKVGAALEDGDYVREAGFVLALLGRCLELQAGALAACAELVEAADDPDQRRAMEALHESIRDSRRHIAQLRKEIKEN